MTIDHYEALFDAKYLRWFDIVERGEVTVTIEDVCREELTMRGGVKKKSPVVTLKGATKQWVLNRTNADMIAKIHGNKPTNWKGKKVTLYVAETQLYNREAKQMETVNCIRVKEAK